MTGGNVARVVRGIKQDWMGRDHDTYEGEGIVKCKPKAQACVISLFLCIFLFNLKIYFLQTGVTTLSEANMTSTMQSIITPTIPTSAPFVFKSHPRLMLSDTVKTTMTDRQSYRLKTAELSQGSSSDEVDGSTRFCSVKGCKAVIPGNQIFILFSYYLMLINENQASDEYKMCPTCRTRYRTYGNTKRVKWKAERDAFDQDVTLIVAASSVGVLCIIYQFV